MRGTPTTDLPEPIRGREIGTFAHYTVTVRMPDIARRTIEENQFEEKINSRLQNLIDDIDRGKIRDLRDESAPDNEAWKGYIQPYRGETWLDVPWFFAEHYFYRRIIEATGYYMKGKTEGYDPYTYQKETGLEASGEAAAKLCQQTIDWTKDSRQDKNPARSRLAALLKADLWGNQADLSIFPAGQNDQPNHTEEEEAQSHLLNDDSRAAAEYLVLSGGNNRIDFLIDNAGFELIADLCLAYFLLQNLITRKVCLQVKVHPTFVSDTIEKDVHTTIEFLASFSEQTRQVAEFLRNSLMDKQLEISPNLFWNSPLALWEMPEPLKTELGQAKLVISKGDAHYRRLLGDRHWAYTTPFAHILNGFSAPLLALRAMKSEIVCGLQPGQVEQASQKDPKWMYDGKWGLIQTSFLGNS
ncbi:MAG: protein-glutamate O-methyltransferase family protein [Chloroflexi bacterium]|nr:MAG: protein-glutamate O-methyltransferase family protein [Chloroflexota bacterium]